MTTPSPFELPVLRYACERCGKDATENYFSDDRCNTNHGFGLVLCEPCANALVKLDDKTFASMDWRYDRRPEVIANQAFQHALKAAFEIQGCLDNEVDDRDVRYVDTVANQVRIELDAILNAAIGMLGRPYLGGDDHKAVRDAAARIRLLVTTLAGN